MTEIDPRQLKGSEVRLWQLIEERTRPGADKKRIDQTPRSPTRFS